MKSIWDSLSVVKEGSNSEQQPELVVTPTPIARNLVTSEDVGGFPAGPTTPDTVDSSFGSRGSEETDKNQDEIVEYDDTMFGVQTADFEVALEDIGTEWYGYMWSFLLGIVGVLDILATVEPQIRNMGGFCTNDTLTLCSAWLSFMRWLDRRNVGISFVFSLLWFKLAFNKAVWAKQRAAIKRDRDILLSQDESNGAGKQREPLHPQVAYFLQIVTSMLFLPVGFYVIIYHFLRDMIFEQNGFVEEIENPMNETIVFSVTEQSYGDEGGGTKYEIFTERTKISLLLAIFHHIRITVMARTVIARAKATEYLRKSAFPVLARKMLTSAIRNPRKFRRNISTSLRYFRYIKYMAPIIGVLNKLKGNVEDTLKKRRQRLIAAKQRRIRKMLWRRKSLAVKEEDAAILIESKWRAHRARRYTYAMILLTQDKKVIAAQRIQSVLRRKLAEARYRIFIKKLELQRLEQKSMRSSKKLGREERRRLYELQDEFTAEAQKTINKRLLMRPNTNFAVLWKLMFLVCIGVEISEKALSPLVRNRLSRKCKDGLTCTTIQELVADQLVPVPVDEWEVCKDLTKKSWAQKLHLQRNGKASNHATMSWYCNNPYATWLDYGRDVISLALKPFPVSEWSECDVAPSKNIFKSLSNRGRDKQTSRMWYCSDPYAWMQKMYRRVVDFFVDKFMVIVSIICFLDVFVTFFTGEIHPETGELVPKPFFQRWILPGLLLQLLLNPAIGPVSSFAFSNMHKAFVIGPVRVLRWCIAVFVPVAYLIFKLIVKALEHTELDESLVDFYISRRRSSVLF